MPLARRSGPAIAALIVALSSCGVASAAPGDLDPGFGTGGIFTGAFQTTFPGNDDAQKVAVDSQGRVYLAATLEPVVGSSQPPRQINVVRLSPQGILDSGYGSGGTATLPFPGDTYMAGLAIDAQDRAVIAGVNDITSFAKVALARLTTAGQPDAGFSDDGQIVTTLPNVFGQALPGALAIDDGGRILVGSTVVVGGQAFGAVSRFTSGGAPDGAYGDQGTRTFGGAGQRVDAIAALPGGTAVAVGRRDYQAWGIARIDASGALDGAFAGDGVFETDLGRQTLHLVEPHAIVVDAQGRYVAAGQYTGATASALVARFTTAGALDPAFGAGTPTPGALFLPGVSGARVRGAVSCGSRILLGGLAQRVQQPTTNGQFVATFAPGGSTPGIVRTEIGEYNVPTDLGRAGGAVIAAGFRRTQSPLEDFPTLTRHLEACDAVPPQPPVPAPVPPSSPAVTLAPAPAASAPSAVTVASAVRFPSTRKCASRRSFSIRLRVPAGAAVTEASVFVNGKRVAVRRGVRLRSTVDLRTLPKGRFRVEVRLRLASGRTLKDSRRYRTCVPKTRR